MTPEQRIKRDILRDAIDNNDDINCDDEIVAENVDELYREVLTDNDLHWDFVSEFRESGEATGLPCDYSRHYESHSVGRKLSDGGWVGWTYWYGGGKWGEPGAIPWMEDAYELDVVEEEKVMTVRTFSTRVAR